MRRSTGTWRLRPSCGTSSSAGGWRKRCLRAIVAWPGPALVELAASVIRSGVKEGTFRTVDPVAAGRAVPFATSRFHHPAHAAEWADPATAATYDEVWHLRYFRAVAEELHRWGADRGGSCDCPIVAAPRLRFASLRSG
jgi:hypothetical protein